MNYAAFTLWIFLIVFMGLGAYRLLARTLGSLWVNWILLPGTIVSQMAYIFGCLITAGEIRRAKIMPTSTKSSADGDGEPKTESTAKLKIIGPIIASLMTIVACAGGILIANALLGGPVIEEFRRTALVGGAEISKQLPCCWDDVWIQIDGQVRLLRHTCRTLASLDWLNWRVPLFVYLSLCLSLRLTPVRRDTRATLAGAMAISLVIAVIGTISSRFTNLMNEVWPLLSYVYAMLLLLLIAASIVRGLVLLGQILAGRENKNA